VTPDSAIVVTVAVCTWNRCGLLAQTLEGLTRLTVPEGVTWELVVVNNRSTDATDDVIATFERRLPVRRVWEPTPGLANARNRAVAEAAGEYVVFTDDDILVQPDWLAAYVASFRRWPDSAIFGGPIEPLFEDGPPAWIPRVLDQIGPVYGLQTLGSTPVPLALETVAAGPYGGNMAMRRDALLRFPFDPRLGVRHGAYGIGEETELMRKMLAAGLCGWWTPEPRVRHWVPRTNQTLAYVRRWMEGCGRYHAQVQEAGDASPRGARLRLHARVVRHEVQYGIRRLTAPPEVWIKDVIRAAHARGRLRAGSATREPGRV
jgi:glucosyl-dolichyl phosphate glucuronosyltransferase